MTDARQVAEELQGTLVDARMLRAGPAGDARGYIEAALRRFAADVLRDMATLSEYGAESGIGTRMRLEAQAKELRGLGELAGGEEET